MRRSGSISWGSRTNFSRVSSIRHLGAINPEVDILEGTIHPMVPYTPKQIIKNKFRGRKSRQNPQSRVARREEEQWSQHMVELKPFMSQ